MTRLDSLTGMRFLAALLVVLHHTVANDVNGTYLVMIPFLRDIATIGFTGVSFFFVLSGFVLAWSARPDDPDRAFWSRRFARVYPLHLLTWVLAFPVLIYAGRELGAGTAVATVLLVQAWSPDSSVVFGMNPLSWTLSCEAFFYAVFPWLHRRLTALGRTRLVSVGLGCGALLVIAPVVGYVLGGRGGVQYFYYFPAYRLLEFVVGVCLAIAMRDGWRPRLSVWAGPAVFVVSVAVVVVATHVYRDHGGGNALPRVAAALVLLPAYLLLIVGGARHDIAGRDIAGRASPFAGRALVRLGVWSFALYLTHLLLLTAVETALDGSRPAGLAANIGVELLAIGVGVAVAAAAYRWFEAPAERFLRSRLASGRGTSGPTAHPDVPRHRDLRPWS